MSFTRDVYKRQEYELLFSEYSSLNEDFAKQELENILTLVNVWRYVLDNQPKGCAIAYDSKQKYRRGTNYFCDTLSKAVTAVNGTLLKGCLLYTSGAFSI